MGNDFSLEPLRIIYWVIYMKQGRINYQTIHFGKVFWRAVMIFISAKNNINPKENHAIKLVYANLQVFERIMNI